MCTLSDNLIKLKLFQNNTARIVQDVGRRERHEQIFCMIYTGFLPDVALTTRCPTGHIAKVSRNAFGSFTALTCTTLLTQIFESKFHVVALDRTKTCLLCRAIPLGLNIFTLKIRGVDTIIYFSFENNNFETVFTMDVCGVSTSYRMNARSQQILLEYKQVDTIRL